MVKHLHLAIIFKASNLNYGESIGNILSLKKLASEGKNFLTFHGRPCVTTSSGF